QGVPIQKSRRVQLGHRAAIYCRVSTADQSCERQEFDLRAFAGRAGYDVVGMINGYPIANHIYSN
ncbi:recombinase family protein, partial [Klebsiella pneumoniae]|uniref:recombinase family protein n=1 Tax=Klebsiella pneumoniae TaxID=573 RepID=UPI001E62726A